MPPLNHPAEQGITICLLRCLIGARLTVPGALVVVAQEDEALDDLDRPLGDQTRAIALVSNPRVATVWSLVRQEGADLPPGTVGLPLGPAGRLQGTEGCVLDEENF